MGLLLFYLAFGIISFIARLYVQSRYLRRR